MSDDMILKPIAAIHSDFPEKFGIPRQSGLVEELIATIVFLPEYRDPDALRGLEKYSHIWLIWEFSECRRDEWSPTVRPPRLGGNTRMGVFATRSPYRPNPIGLSCVRLLKIENDDNNGVVLRVAGADLMDGTPIFDIKPYIPYADARPGAAGGFTDETPKRKVKVAIPDELLAMVPNEKQAALTAVLAEDPRPAYHDSPDRVYGMSFAGVTVRFSVKNGLLTVTEVLPER